MANEETDISKKAKQAYVPESEVMEEGDNGENQS